jgi:hypothetical protein
LAAINDPASLSIAGQNSTSRLHFRATSEVSSFSPNSTPKPAVTVVIIIAVPFVAGVASRRITVPVGILEARHPGAARVLEHVVGDGAEPVLVLVAEQLNRLAFAPGVAEAVDRAEPLERQRPTL